MSVMLVKLSELLEGRTFTCFRHALTKSFITFSELQVQLGFVGTSTEIFDKRLEVNEVRCYWIIPFAETPGIRHHKYPLSMEMFVGQ